MRKFTLRDVDSVKAGDAIVGVVRKYGFLAGVRIPLTIADSRPAAKKYMEIFFRVFSWLTKGKMWIGYMVDIDLEENGPFKLVFEEVRPRVFSPVRWEEAEKYPTKTYYTFI